jgi:hypothetical protein
MGKRPRGKREQTLAARGEVLTGPAEGEQIPSSSSLVAKRPECEEAVTREQPAGSLAGEVQDRAPHSLPLGPPLQPCGCLRWQCPLG